MNKGKIEDYVFEEIAPVVTTLVIAGLLTIAVMWGLFGVLEATGEAEEMRTYADNAKQWCDAEGGYLYNAQSVAHGGLHCDIEGKPLVHMWMIDDIGWTHDWETIQNTPKATHANMPWYTGYGWVPFPFLMAFVFALVGAVTIASVNRFVSHPKE